MYKTSDGKDNWNNFWNKMLFFPIKALKIFEIQIFQNFFLGSWKHMQSQIIISTMCIENQTWLYTQLEWTNGFSILCHLWKGAYGNIRRLIKTLCSTTMNAYSVHKI